MSTNHILQTLHWTEMLLGSDPSDVQFGHTSGLGWSDFFQSSHEKLWVEESTYILY